MEILFEDKYIVVAVKPRGALSESHEREENMPALLGGNVFPVHRLDRGVGGVMVYAKTREAAATLSATASSVFWVRDFSAMTIACAPSSPAGTFSGTPLYS